MKRLLVISIGLFSLAIIGNAFPSASLSPCPNWSPKFDKITNPEVKKKLKEMKDWDGLIAESGGPVKILITFKNSLKDAKKRLEIAQQDVDKLASDEASKRPSTWEECKNPVNALAASSCEVLNLQELILTLEGSIELAQCRLNNQ